MERGNKFDPSENKEEDAKKYFMYDRVHGLDPQLLAIPYKLHLTPFSELHAEETKAGSFDSPFFFCVCVLFLR
jgi:hypothetical protein